MRSAQVYSRFRSSTVNDIGDGSRLDDDVCSLNSWSDDISHINLNGSHSRSSSSTEDSTNCFGDLKYSEQNDIKRVKKSKYVEGTDRKRVSSGLDPTKCDEISRQNSTSGSIVTVSTMATSRGGNIRRSFREKVHDCDRILSRSHPNTFPQSPSLDLKSASFIYPASFDKSQPTPHTENQPPVIKDELESHSHYSRPKEHSLPTPPPAGNAQRLYPNIDDIKLSHDNDSDRSLYLKLPNQESNSFSKSKVSPSRPQFFDFQRATHARAHTHKQNPTGAPLSPLRNSSELRTQSVIGRSAQIISAPSMYFKSQPVICTQQPGLSIRQNNSSNDLESMNKQVLEHRLEPDNVKSKMMSVWNNIKYGWTFKSKSNIKLDSPLFLLGKVYHKRNDDDEESDFLQDFTSRIWLTYRNNFYPIPGTKLSTDCGWGCMLRSGQMLMAQCFVNHFLGRDWRIHNHQKETQLSYYREILRWFSDPVEAPSDTVPFCLHNLVNIGRHYSKVPGEWYGPASVAYIFRDALNRANLSIPILKDLCVYVAQDCTVYIDDVNKLCRTRSNSGSEATNHTATQHSNSELDAPTSSQCLPGRYNQPWCRSLIILIPVRLGGESMNEIYSPCIKSLLSYNNCMGIIGGKPKHSLYFIGWQDDKLIYLDPHFCREAVDTSNKDFSIETFHCTSPRKLAINKMDPSCTVGFYIRDADEFQKFVHDVTEFVSPPKQKGLYPLFIFSNGSQEDAELAQGHMGAEQGRVKVKHYVVDQYGQRHRTVARESEEFIML